MLLCLKNPAVVNSSHLADSAIYRADDQIRVVRERACPFFQGACEKVVKVPIVIRMLMERFTQIDVISGGEFAD